INGRFQSVPCMFVDINTLRCTLPASMPGPAGVRVTNSDGRSDQKDEALNFFDITDVNPDRGPSQGGTRVTITGLFLPPTSQIYFGENNLANCTWASDTRMTCTTPPGPPDSFVDVLDLPPDPGQTPAILENGYFYVAPPNITSIEPDQG